MEEEVTFQEIIDMMAVAEDYGVLYDAAGYIKNTSLRLDVEEEIGQCEDDGDPAEVAYSVVTSDLLDSMVDEPNVEVLEESDNGEGVTKIGLFANQVKDELQGRGYKVDTIDSDEELITMAAVKGNAGMCVAVYSADNSSFDFNADTIGLGGDTLDDITVYPIYQELWGAETASPSGDAEVGKEVYAMFNSIYNTTAEEVANIVDKSFKSTLNEGLSKKTEARVTDYIDEDDLDNIIKQNPNFRNCVNYEADEDMILKVSTKGYTDFDTSYKVIRRENGKFYAYKLDDENNKVGDEFYLTEGKRKISPEDEEYFNNEIDRVARQEIKDKLKDGKQEPDDEIEKEMDSLEESIETIDNSDEEDIATILYDQIMENNGIDHGEIEGVEMDSYEQLKDWYDEGLDKSTYTKAASIAAKAAKNAKFYTSDDDHKEYIELNANRTWWDIGDRIEQDKGKAFQELVDTGIYNELLEQAADEFEMRANTKLFFLGRQARHVCVSNTFLNAYKYNELQDIQRELEENFIDQVVDHVNGWEDDDTEEDLEESKIVEEKSAKQDFNDYCSDRNLDNSKKSSVNKYLNDYAKNYAQVNGVENLESELAKVRKELREGCGKKTEAASDEDIRHIVRFLDGEGYKTICKSIDKNDLLSDEQKTILKGAFDRSLNKDKDSVHNAFVSIQGFKSWDSMKKYASSSNKEDGLEDD